MKSCLIRFSLVLLFAADGGAAQSLTVIGGGSDARNCSLHARLGGQGVVSLRRAADICSRALEHASLSRADHAATYVNRGILLAADGRFTEALDDYNRAIELAPSLAEPYVGRGNLVFLAGRFDIAVAEYDRALAMALGSRHIGLYNRALALAGLGRSEAAIADLREALTLEPGWLPAQQKLEELQPTAASGRR